MEYCTADLPLVAVLLQQQIRLLRIERRGSKTFFVFTDSAELRDLIECYWRDELLCPAQSLLASFKRAKHILYDANV